MQHPLSLALKVRQALKVQLVPRVQPPLLLALRVRLAPLVRLVPRVPTPRWLALLVRLVLQVPLARLDHRALKGSRASKGCKGSRATPRG